MLSWARTSLTSSKWHNSVVCDEPPFPKCSISVACQTAVAKALALLTRACTASSPCTCVALYECAWNVLELLRIIVPTVHASEMKVWGCDLALDGSGGCWRLLVVGGGSGRGSCQSCEFRSLAGDGAAALWKMGGWGAEQGSEGGLCRGHTHTMILRCSPRGRDSTTAGWAPESRTGAHRLPELHLPWGGGVRGSRYTDRPLAVPAPQTKGAQWIDDPIKSPAFDNPWLKGGLGSRLALKAGVPGRVRPYLATGRLVAWSHSRAEC